MRALEQREQRHREEKVGEIVDRERELIAVCADLPPPPAQRDARVVDERVEAILGVEDLSSETMNLRERGEVGDVGAPVATCLTESLADIRGLALIAPVNEYGGAVSREVLRASAPEAVGRARDQDRPPVRHGATLLSTSQRGERRRVSEPVFLITGASSGIGAATARHAAEAGYRVVLAARSLDELEALADELGGSERALAVRCDVTEWSDQEAMVRAALDAYGRIDVAFANAGFGAKRGFLQESIEHWRAMVLTNVYGCALTVRAALPALKQSAGHLLLTGSVAGRRALPGSLYSCTKWAVTAMGEAARLELNGTGVRVTLVEPGMVATPFFERAPQGALEADDVARAVMFAVAQPAHVDVNEILVRPTAQEA
jgi:NADP-dependent 3-hydroxy acid dehydrogenase YdfG